MMCSSCSTAFFDKWEHFSIKASVEENTQWVCKVTVCPQCNAPHANFKKMMTVFNSWEARNVEYVLDEFLAYQSTPEVMQVSEHVPADLARDYKEAHAVLSLSPKASAALSRRVLQALLQEQGYAGGNLARQVDAVLGEKDPSKVLPASIKDNVDAIRNFGNFSAHPITDVTSLQVIDVEPAEAEWCLEIVERLFDHYYVRPAADARRLAELNTKLQQADKPPAKA